VVVDLSKSILTKEVRSDLKLRINEIKSGDKKVYDAIVGFSAAQRILIGAIVPDVVLAKDIADAKQKLIHKMEKAIKKSGAY
jgi:hypothetical protein